MRFIKKITQSILGLVKIRIEFPTISEIALNVFLLILYHTFIWHNIFNIGSYKI